MPDSVPLEGFAAGVLPAAFDAGGVAAGLGGNGAACASAAPCVGAGGASLGFSGGDGVWSLC